MPKGRLTDNILQPIRKQSTVLCGRKETCKIALKEISKTLKPQEVNRNIARDHCLTTASGTISIFILFNYKPSFVVYKVHPDKNKHPRAGEAFKVLRAAWDIVSNPETRREYEL